MGKFSKWKFFIDPHFNKYWTYENRILIYIDNIFQVTSSEIPQLNYYFVPIIIITLATYFIADIFFGVYEMAVDTLFLCFLEDIERNDGSDEKPYFMSKDLRKILGYMEPKSTPTSPK